MVGRIPGRSETWSVRYLVGWLRLLLLILFGVARQPKSFIGEEGEEEDEEELVMCSARITLIHNIDSQHVCE